MSIEEYKEKYKGMSSAQVRGLISSSSEFRNETESLYTSIYHQKLNKNCGDCWLDAYILIMKGNPEKLKAMQEKRFDLRAGAVLIDPHGDPKKTITHLNITDELALYHLRTHPDCIKMFSLYPEDWENEAIQSGIEDDRKANQMIEPKEEIKVEEKKAEKGAEIPANEVKPAEVNKVSATKKKVATSKKKSIKK